MRYGRGFRFLFALLITALANAVTLAATWDREQASQHGKALGEESVGKGSNSVLGPTINIMRTWN